MSSPNMPPGGLDPHLNPLTSANCQSPCINVPPQGAGAAAATCGAPLSMCSSGRAVQYSGLAFKLPEHALHCRNMSSDNIACRWDWAVRDTIVVITVQIHKPHTLDLLSAKKINHSDSLQTSTEYLSTYYQHSLTITVFHLSDKRTLQ